MTDEPTPTPESTQPEPTSQPDTPAPAEPEATSPQPEPAPPDQPATEPVVDAPAETFTFSAEKKKSSVVNPYVWGTGRRKASVARVRIRPGEGKFVINKKEVEDYFRLDQDRGAVQTPLRVTDTTKSVDVFVNVSGGGTSGQAGAVLLGLARALAKADPSCEPRLREHNLLSRDPRRVERKKYGRRGARRRFQFSKR